MLMEDSYENTAGFSGEVGEVRLEGGPGEEGGQRQVANRSTVARAAERNPDPCVLNTTIRQTFRQPGRHRANIRLRNETHMSLQYTLQAWLGRRSGSGLASSRLMLPHW